MKYRIGLLILVFVVFSSLIKALAMSQPIVECPQIVFSEDTMLYLNMIQRATLSNGHGDPFLYEHRDETVISEANNYWIVLLSKIKRYATFNEVLVLLPLFYLLWVGSLCRIYRHFGIAEGPAIFLSFLVVNILFGIAGGIQGTHTLQWMLALPWQDYWRLYPTVISMSFYVLAIFATIKLWQKEKPTGFAVLAGICAGVVIYGRPFDWTVTFTFQALLFGYACFLRHKPRAFNLAIALIVGGAVCAPYIFNYLSLFSGQKELFNEILGRGNIQMKEFTHYVKYFFFMSATLAILYAVKRWGPQARQARSGHELHPVLFLLVAAAFLPHFATVISGKTIVGFGYYFYASIVPWSFLALTVFLFSHRDGKWMQSFPLWIILSALLVVGDAWWMHHRASELVKSDNKRAERRECYDWLRNQKYYHPECVVLTFDSANELMLNLNCYTFLTTSPNQTYVTNASTAELFERFLLAEMMVHGEVNFISKIIDANGMSLADLTKQMNDREQLRFHNLRRCIGNNSFVFHPEKNRLDLKAKGITLPGHLSQLSETVVFFNTTLVERFKKFEEEYKEQSKYQAIVGRFGKIPYRLNYLIAAKDELKASAAWNAWFQPVFETNNYRVLAFVGKP
jgi:hypothetical protein